MGSARLEIGHTALLIVDVQEKLLSHMYNRDLILDQVCRLLDAALVLDVPVLVTEQYPKGLGPTVSAVAERLAGRLTAYEKLKFSACVEPIREALVEHMVNSVLICGIESHVCVLQTCLELQSKGYLPFLVADGISSRRELDHQTAVHRMIQAGVIPTTVESAILELVQKAGSDRFKAVLPLIK